VGPLYGRQAIEKFYADEFKAWHNKNFDRTIDPNSYRIIGTADNVASNGGWSFTAQAEGGEPFPNQGLLVSDSYSRGRCLEDLHADLEHNTSACSDEIDEERRAAEQPIAS